MSTLGIILLIVGSMCATSAAFGAVDAIEGVKDKDKTAEERLENAVRRIVADELVMFEDDLGSIRLRYSDGIVEDFPYGEARDLIPVLDAWVDGRLRRVQQREGRIS